MSENVSNNDGPVYSVLSGKPCAPCGPGYVLVWQYQNYPSQAACEESGYQFCCTCITND